MHNYRSHRVLEDTVTNPIVHTCQHDHAVRISTVLPRTSRELQVVQEIKDDNFDDDIFHQEFNDKGQNNGVTVDEKWRNNIWIFHRKYHKKCHHRKLQKIWKKLRFPHWLLHNVGGNNFYFYFITLNKLYSLFTLQFWKEKSQNNL